MYDGGLYALMGHRRLVVSCLAVSEHLVAPVAPGWEAWCLGMLQAGSRLHASRGPDLSSCAEARALL